MVVAFYNHTTSSIFLMKCVPSILLSLATFLLFSACTSTKLITRKEQKILKNQIADSPIFTKGFTGFQLYDPENKTVLHEQAADKYFTPASNTKIFTYYAASQILGDTLPALKYVIRGDSLIFWGTGDPSLLHPHITDNQKIIDFLNQQTAQLFYCPDNFMEERYGAGWMWDDYPYYFQVEMAALPIYGNFIRVQAPPKSRNFTITPDYFSKQIKGVPTINGQTARFYRQREENIIEYNEKSSGSSSLDRELPFLYSDNLLLQLLQDSIKQNIQLITGIGSPPVESQTIYGGPTDSIMQRMMLISDNFLAEQLILLCASEVFDTLNIRKGIGFIKDSILNDSPDELLWYDGSGLTRYNQFTPRSLVHVLEKIYTEIPSNKWQSVFPSGGQTGTIKNYFGNQPHPYVYAKTGTIRNVRCLSGYVLTKSGKTLIFSFMNNAIPGSSRPWTEEMEKVLGWIHENL